MPKLVNLSIEETSGVDHPAHLREGWMILKASESEANELLNILKTELGQPDNTEASMPEETTEIVEIDETGDELAKALERIAELESALAAAETTDEIVEDEDEALLKSVPESVRKMIEEQKNAAADALAKAAAVEAELRVERTARADELAIAKAAGWTALTLDPAVVGPALRKAAEVDAELASALEQILDAANAQSESAGLFAEIGKAGRPDTGDAYEALSALAKAAVDSGDAPTFEQAFVKAAEQNPDLYNRHLNEKGA